MKIGKFRINFYSKSRKIKELEEKLKALENPKLGNLSYEQLIILRKQLMNEINDVMNRLRIIERTHKTLTNDRGRNIGEYNKKNKK